MNIVVLTSKENFVWHSMQEIIPYIEETWNRVNSKNTHITILNIDDMSLAQLTPHLLKATHVVLTCFNIKVCKTAFFARETLRLPVNFIVYVHNMATIAFWPFRQWGCENFFKKNDLFVTSCENDKNTLLSVFCDPKIIVIPFFVLNQTNEFLNKTQNKIQYLVYVGRISPQKNIHNLILAYHLLKTKLVDLPPLVLFGKEDNLGSPNMGLAGNEYQKYLESLIAHYNLTELIVFKGHVERATINEFLSEHACLSVSASLHSDENFGMAILQSLLLGNCCLISDWGGHSDFKKYFPHRVHLMHVKNSHWGPSLSAQLIAESIQLILEDELKHISINLHEDYDINLQGKRLLNSLNQNYENEPLRFSDLADLLFKNKNKSSMQIFKDYTDNNFHKVSETYRGNYSRAYSRSKLENYVLVPWVRNEGDFYLIEDPHKGVYKIKADSESLDLLFNGAYLICKT